MKKFISILALLSGIAHAGSDPSNLFKLGDGTASDKQIKFNTGASNQPAFKWNNSAGQLEFSNDGASFTALGGQSGMILRNLVTNYGAESDANNWTASGGTFVRTTTAADVATGTGSFSWDSNATSQTLDSSLVAIPEGMKGLPGFATCKVRCASGSCTHTMAVHDGTSNVGNPTNLLSSTTTFARTTVGFTFPTSGSLRIRYTSVASNEPTLLFDDCYIGLTDEIGPKVSMQTTTLGLTMYPACTSGPTCTIESQSKIQGKDWVLQVSFVSGGVYSLVYNVTWKSKPHCMCTAGEDTETTCQYRIATSTTTTGAFRTTNLSASASNSMTVVCTGEIEGYDEAP